MQGRNILFCLMAFCLSGTAQNTQDAGLWTTVSVSRSITKKISLSVDQEMRLRENFQRINLFYTNIGFDYKINKNLKISPTYRAIQKKLLEPGFSYRHRFQLDVTAKKKFNKITVSERVRYQAEVQNYLTSAKGKIPEHYLRFKTDIKYTALEKVTPYVSCEFRYQLTAPRGDDPDFNYGFHRVRNIAGIEYKLNDSNSLGLYYLVQSEFDISNKETIYIVGVAYSINL
jgi:long-subunit fatty acid transport protein